MKRIVALFILIGIVAGEEVWSEEEHPPEPVGTGVTEQRDVMIYEAILPGELLDWGVVSEDSGPDSLALLLGIAADDDGTESRQLWIWQLGGAGELKQTGRALPEAANTLVISAAGATGKSEVIVAADGALMGLTREGEWRELLATSHDVFPVRGIRGRRETPTGELVLQSVGRLRAFGSDWPTGGLGQTWELDLPVRVEREWSGLRLITPPVMRFPGSEAGPSRFVVGPDAQGKQRLRSWLITPGEANEVESMEIWNMLSMPEDIQESWYVTFNGSPALIVTTVLAEKHGVFEKKKLRLFKLTADRTRAGSSPLLETITRSRHWYSTCAGIADINGDGLDDLVSAQPKGLGAGTLWVEGHLSLDGGGFHSRARGSELEVEEGEICSLDSDLDGDGQVDLWVRENDSLLVFLVSPAKDAKIVVQDSPRWRVDFDEIVGRPWPVQIFAGEATQILVSGRTEGKRPAVRVLRFR